MAGIGLIMYTIYPVPKSKVIFTIECEQCFEDVIFRNMSELYDGKVECYNCLARYQDEDYYREKYGNISSKTVIERYREGE